MKIISTFIYTLRYEKNTYAYTKSFYITVTIITKGYSS